MRKIFNVCKKKKDISLRGKGQQNLSIKGQIFRHYILPYQLWWLLKQYINKWAGCVLNKTLYIWGFSSGTVVKEPPAIAGDPKCWVWSLGLGESPEAGNGHSIIFSLFFFFPLCIPHLENSTEREAWAPVHMFTYNQILLKRLSKHAQCTGIVCACQF